MVRTLVITSCTGEKASKPLNQLVQKDFEDKGNLVRREQELEEYKVTASKLYTGMQHMRLMEGINLLRNRFGNNIIDLEIVSAGYGLINESMQVVPYEVTFNTMNGKEIAEWSNYLNIHNDVSKKIADYDMVIFLLGDKYLKALGLPLDNATQNQKLIFLASNTSKKMIPNSEPYYFIEVGQEDAKSFSYGLVGLKGYLFKLLAQELVEYGQDLLSKIYVEPRSLIEILAKYRKEEDRVEQLSLFPDEPTNKTLKSKNNGSKKEVNFYVPKEQYAKNYNEKMLYFIPEWDDRVDPDYNFIKDTSPEGRDTYLDDVYAHEIFSAPNYDGILVSKIKVDEPKIKKLRIKEEGIHKFLRVDKDMPIMGDCGAFSYVNEFEPPYNSREILEHYQSSGFNIGVSIDHLIVGEYAKDLGERKRRYNITRDNAADFIKNYRECGYSFLPSGVAQGWDPESYRDAVSELIDMGYKHISLGGLARTPSTEIFEIMKLIAPIVPEYLQLHLFGVARLEPIQAFRQLGITSFDSASYLRRAWLGSGSNYFALDGSKYTAIRVPPVDGHGVRVKKMVSEGRGTIDQFRVMEAASLNALRKYDEGKMSLDDTLKIVLEYDELIGEDRDSHIEMYRTVLEEKPWKKCDCKICRDIGIEVIIFRGNNRNRRRGFHNTYIFYKQFKDILKQNILL